MTSIQEAAVFRRRGGAAIRDVRTPRNGPLRARFSVSGPGQRGFVVAASSRRGRDETQGLEGTLRGAASARRHLRATRDVGTPRNDRHPSRRTKTERQLRDGRQTESEQTGSGGNCGTSGATRYIERVNGHSARGWRTRGEHVRPARRHAVRVATLDGRRGRSICNSHGTSGARAFRGQDLGRR